MRSIAVGLRANVGRRLRFVANRTLRGADERRRLLVVGSGARAMRGYLLEAIHRRGFPVTLLCDAPPTWELPFIDRYVVADLARPEAALEAALRDARTRPPAGCLTYVEVNVPLAALISETLGLRLYGTKVAERARDKGLMRRRLREAGLPMPRSVPVGPGELRAAAAELGLPAVFKPVRGEGSVNVLKVEDEAGLAVAERLMAASRATPGWRYGGYLLEEYVDGVEYSVESIVAGGRILHAAVTDKYKGAEPYFEELGHAVPSVLPAGAAAETLEVVTRAIEAMGLDGCAVHTELKRSSKGVVVIEMGGRLAGDRIPRLVELALGIDLADAAALAAVGEPVHLPSPTGRFASVGFFVPAREQVQPAGLASPPCLDGLAEFEFWGRAGERAGVPPKDFLLRLGYAVGVAGTYAASRAVIEEARLAVAAQTGLELLPFARSPEAEG